MRKIYDSKELIGQKLKVTYADTYYEREIECECMEGDLEHDIEGLEKSFIEWTSFPARTFIGEDDDIPLINRMSYIFIQSIDDEFENGEEVIFNCYPIEWEHLKNLNQYEPIQVTWIKPDSQLALFNEQLKEKYEQKINP